VCCCLGRHNAVTSVSLEVTAGRSGRRASPLIQPRAVTVPAQGLEGLSSVFVGRLGWRGVALKIFAALKNRDRSRARGGSTNAPNTHRTAV
jgi:hypothetical protein